MKLKQTKEPVTSIAGAIAAPEPLRSLTWRWAPDFTMLQDTQISTPRSVWPVRDELEQMPNQSNQEQFRQLADFLAAMNKQIGILADLSSKAISRPPSVGRD